MSLKNGSKVLKIINKDKNPGLEIIHMPLSTQ